MQASQALLILIEQADHRIVDLRGVLLNHEVNLEYIKTSAPSQIDVHQSFVDEAKSQLERVELATAICTAMMNTALPVARYRAFVELDKEQPKRTKQENLKAPMEEFTVCGTTMASIISGIRGLADIPTNVRVMIFEQKATNAEVITAYQGNTKTGQYRLFLKQLPALEEVPTVQ